MKLEKPLAAAVAVLAIAVAVEGWRLHRLEKWVLQQSFAVSMHTSHLNFLDDDLRKTRVAMGLERPSPIEQQAEALRRLMPKDEGDR